MNETDRPVFHSGLVLFTAFLIVLALQGLIVIADWERLETGGLLGPDSYMRLLRVEKLFQGGDWYDRISERTNAPYGEILPWGRPLDAVLAAIAALATLFTESRTAVYCAGLAIGPLIAFLMIPAWSWGTRPFLGGGTFLMIFVLSGLTPALLLNLKIGRADHHGFLALLFILQLCSAFRLAAGKGNASDWVPALLLGIVGGVAIWTSVMTLTSQLMIAILLALRYLRQDARSTHEILFYTIGVAAMISVALPLERPPSDWLTVEFKRLSIVHWTLAATAAATWWAIQRRDRHGPVQHTIRSRLAVLMLGGAVPLAIMAIVFPNFFLSPSVDFDPETVQFYYTSIIEARPLFPTTTAALAQFFLQLGPTFIGFGFIIYDYRRAAADRRAVYDVLLVGIVVFVPLALWMRRFAIEAQILALLPWAMTLTGIMTWTRTVTIGKRAIPLRGFVVVAAVIAPLLLTFATGGQAVRSTPKAEAWEWQQVGKFLTDFAHRNGGAKDSRAILFSHFTRGPELAWRTPYRVVGAPYANVDALRDTRLIFRAETDAQARRVIDRRGIDLILFSNAAAENKFHRKGKSGSFLSRIENDAIPDWLQPVPLPEPLAHRFKLFRVVRGAP